MTGKWKRLTPTEYTLKPEFAPANIVVTVYESEIPGRYDAIITNTATSKRIASARPLALSTMKHKALAMAHSQMVQTITKKDE